jgi:hypothetical protein
MTPLEYALGLISILMSLALADILMSLHRLMRHAGTIKWDGRILVATRRAADRVTRWKRWCAPTCRVPVSASAQRLSLYCWTHSGRVG